MSDAPRMERATKAFRVAINEALKRVDVIEQDTTNPTAVVDNDAELVNASYAAAMEVLRLLRKETKRLSQEATVEQVCDALADFAVTETVPNAEDWVNRFHEEVESVKTIVETTKEYLGDSVVSDAAVAEHTVGDAGLKKSYASITLSAPEGATYVEIEVKATAESNDGYAVIHPAYNAFVTAFAIA